MSELWGPNRIGARFDVESVEGEDERAFHRCTAETRWTKPRAYQMDTVSSGSDMFDPAHDYRASRGEDHHSSKGSVFAGVDFASDVKELKKANGNSQDENWILEKSQLTGIRTPSKAPGYGCPMCRACVDFAQRVRATLQRLRVFLCQSL